MRDPSRFLLTALAALLVPGLPATAAPDEAAYARVNAALAEHHVLPRYGKLEAATKDFDAAASILCRQSPPRDLAAAKTAFGAAMDAWMAVAHVRHGPVELFMRNFRFHFWPDRRARGGRQLRELLSRRDDGILDPDVFRTASVAVQGLPVAERLLFNDATARMIRFGADGDFPCRLLAAIAFNLSDMAAGMAAEWRESFVKEIRNPGGTDARFANHRAATAAFVKGLHTSLQAIVDYKLDRPLGNTRASARPGLAEAWRSGRSLRNIVRDLEGHRAMYEGEGEPGLRALLGLDREDLADLLSRAFEQTLATARSIRIPLAQAVTDRQERAKIERLATEVRALKELVSGRLAPALGTPIGFNALDGD